MKKIILIISLVFFPMISFCAMPAFPMAFWGEVTIDGNPAPKNTIIKAYYGDTLAGQVVTQTEGIYGYSGSTQQKLVIGEGQGEILFKFQSASINNGNETTGITAQTYAGFESGKTVLLKLSFILLEQISDNNVTSGNASGGSGGTSGGGGGYTPLTTANKKGDANNDNKVDILDFNTLMINWGKIGGGILTDFNNDNKVDIFDFNLLMINWAK